MSEAESHSYGAGVAGARLSGVLHVGLPKTGSTALQRFVLSRHPQIAYFSKAPNGGELPFQAEWEAFFNHILSEDELCFDYEEAADFVSRHFAPSQNSGLLPVISLEEFTGSGGSGLVQKANRLSCLFPGFQILLVIRHPLDLLQSAYFQNINNLDRRPFRDTAPAMEALFREAVANPAHPLSPLLIIHFFNIANLYAQRFGRNRVKVMLYEDFKHEPDKFLKDLSVFCGLDPATTEQVYRDNNEAINVRKSLGQVVYTQLTRQLTRYPVGWRVPKRIRWALAEALARLPSVRKRFERLTPETQQRIEEIAAPQCDAVAAEWGLDVERFGYPSCSGKSRG